jgi:hypothetical protein
MKTSDGGKGSARRSDSDSVAYATGWEVIFGKSRRKTALQELVDISQELRLYDDPVEREDGN